MKRYDFASIALKILGIIWFVQAIPYVLRGSVMPFTGIAKMEGAFNWKVEVGTMFLFGVLYLIAGYLLVVKNEAILRILKIAAEGSETGGSPNVFRPLAFLVLGLYFAIPALGRIIHDSLKWVSLSKGMSSSTYQMFEQTYLWDVLPSLGENTIKLIIGSALILSLNPEKIKSLWKKLRPLSENENGRSEGNQ